MTIRAGWNNRHLSIFPNIIIDYDCEKITLQWLNAYINIYWWRNKYV